MGDLDKADRSQPLHCMFTTVPPRYDLINTLITWGFDRQWRRRAARECLASRPGEVLDLCCGTSDLAINLARLDRDEMTVVGIDYSQPMLKLANIKAASAAGGREISFLYGDAAALPFPKNFFGCVGISFAFRNLTYQNLLTRRCLAEVLRVLKPGGRFVVVETSQPGLKLIRKLYHLYLRWFVSPLGSLLSGNQGAYRYLAESAAHFYRAGEVKELLLQTGFGEVSYQPLFLGVAGIHVAVK
ncbi:ubiquinone/menaquinone biosynthesis methyltransferase [Chloroflexota bacterium]